MSKQNRLLALKKLAGRLGVAGISALICLPAGAQIQPNPGIKNSSADDERARIAQSTKESGKHQRMFPLPNLVHLPLTLVLGVQVNQV